MKPQQRKRLRSPKITTRDVDPRTNLGIGLIGTMIIELRCQLPNLTQEGVFGQTIRTITPSVGIDLLREGTTRIVTMIVIMIPKLDHCTSQTRTNLEIGEVTMTVHDRLQRRDKNHLSRISADNPDQFRLTLQCLTGLETETRATTYPTRNAQLPTTVNNQT